MALPLLEVTAVSVGFGGVLALVEGGEWVREHRDSGYECDMGQLYRF